MNWLDPDGVAERLNVSRRTAVGLMRQMPHVALGKERLRYRVSETELDRWMLSRQTGAKKQRRTP